MLGAHVLEHFLLPGMGKQYRAGRGDDHADEQDQEQAAMHGTKNLNHVITPVLP
jgi:hypothetical protein